MLLVPLGPETNMAPLWTRDASQSHSLSRLRTGTEVERGWRRSAAPTGVARKPAHPWSGVSRPRDRQSGGGRPGRCVAVLEAPQGLIFGRRRAGVSAECGSFSPNHRLAWSRLLWRWRLRGHSSPSLEAMGMISPIAQWFSLLLFLGWLS